MTEFVESAESESTTRVSEIVGGLFAVCFGLPFTLVPLMLVPIAFIDAENGLFMQIFLIAFSLPFLFAGLAVQFTGFQSIRNGLFPKAKELEHVVQDATKDISAFEQAALQEVGDVEKENFWDTV
tara:strand:+ start:98932 stop:99306 length:375 start_codon:yes stop_codon:yes gene_type:complete